MKILILTQYYPPEHGAPQNRLHDLAMRLDKLGCQVSVLTSMPNYPTGKVFDDYTGKFTVSEEIDGIPVTRSWIAAFRTKGVGKQLLSYFSFVLSSVIVGVWKVGEQDVIICESPPLFLGISAYFLSGIKGAKLVMNVSDLWPESAVQLGIICRGKIFKILEFFELFLYRESAFVSCQTVGIAVSVKSRLPDTKTVLFPNGVDLEKFVRHPKYPDFRSKHGIPEKSLIVGYAGNHGRSQALGSILDTAERLQGKDIFFAFFGDGPEKDELAESAKKKNLANVGFFASEGRDEMPELISQFDLALVPLRDIPIFEGARPSKMFELMSCRVPFIFCGKGEGADIAMKSGCAMVVPPENPSSTADAILKFADLAEKDRDELGAEGRTYVEDFFDREKIAENFFKMLSQIRNL